MTAICVVKQNGYEWSSGTGKNKKPATEVSSDRGLKFGPIFLSGFGARRGSGSVLVACLAVFGEV